MAAHLSSSSPPTSPRHLGSLSKMGPWDAEEDSQSLFQRHSVVEIRELEKRARGDIERKKEELRLMVGERYRDLIDAADTIGDMKDCSKKVNSSIKTIQGNCKELYQTHQSRGVAGQVTTPSMNNPKTKFYSVASQMKLLVDTPEKIWNALEHNENLKAAQLFLLAQNIVSSLHIDTGTNAPSKLLASFPILPRQWSSISHFKDSILQGSRKLLRDYTQTEQTMAECLCAIMFLEDSSPRQVFNEFLIARQASLQDLFHPSQQVTGIKTQLCEVVRLVMSSLYQVFILFNSGDNGKTSEPTKENKSLLFEMVENITSRTDSAASEGELLKHLFGQDFDLALLRHLPTSVAGFRPRLRSVSSFITTEYIQNNCKTWFQKCAEDVKKGMPGSFLKYIGTLKGLASIRDAIWELLNPSTDSSSGTYQNTVVSRWEEVTTSCLGNKLSLWHELFRDEFVSRSKTILQGQLESLVSSCKSATTKALEDLSSNAAKLLWERNLSLYVWQESSTDLPSKAGNGKHGDKDGRCGTEGGLTLKTKACTPVIQGLCNDFNDRLGLILDDAAHFIKYSENNEETKPRPGVTMNLLNQSKIGSSTQENGGPFERYGDSKELDDFLQVTCSSVIKSLLSEFHSLLSSYKNQVASFSWKQPLFRTDTPALVLAVDRGLLLARLCRGLSEYCGNLGRLMGEIKEEKTRKPRYSKTPTRRKTSERKSTRMQELKEQFKATCVTAFGIWSKWVSAMFRTSFQTYLGHGQGPNALLVATSWDEIVIDEETETGTKVHSAIHVPSQVSSYATSLLFSLCEELNRVGGYAIDRSILRDLVCALSDDVLTCYEKLLQNHQEDKENVVIDQNRALQLVFDFKFISTIFGERSKTEENADYKSRFEKVIERLEDIVDPFDLNVFSPYITSNLNKHLQRCGVLYGVLLNIDKHSQFYGMPQRPSRGPQDQHNVMPIATNPARFTLLPLSSHQTERTEHRNISESDSEKSPNDLPFYKHQEFIMGELILDGGGGGIRDC